MDLTNKDHTRPHTMEGPLCICVDMSQLFEQVIHAISLKVKKDLKIG